jgi:dimethylargininase
MSEVISRAWVRGVPDTFDQAITMSARGPRPDVARARRQHDDYVSRLEGSGLDVTRISEDERHPDCVFIEDTAVLLGSLLVATRPGAVDRRGEVEPVIAAISGYFESTSIKPPGTLDGGDVMIMGDRVYVGRSARTNDAGIDQLAAIASAMGMVVVPVPVVRVLHLKSAVLPVDAETVVVTPGTVDERVFDGLRVIHEVAGEHHQFSALPLGDRVLVTMSAPATAAQLEALGLPIDPIDVSEILAADGGLTCMSVIAPALAD